MPLPNGNLYDNFLIHGCYYRHIDDLGVPWVPSPVVLPRQLDEEDEAAIAVKFPSYPPFTPSTSTSTSSSFRIASTPSMSTSSSSERGPQYQSAPRQIATTQKRRSWISRSIRRIFRFHPSSVSVPQREIGHRQNLLPNRFTGWKGPFPPPSDPDVEIVPLSDWKAWGYYACPYVNKVFVKNYSIEPRLYSSLDSQAMFDSLRLPDETDEDPNECEHPERWRRGQRLASLPPRPTRWKPVDPTKEAKFPYECQLNPILTLLDPLSRTPTIEWSVTHPADTVFFYTGPSGRVSPLRQPDFFQPATYPFVHFMYFDGLAFASDPDGWWARDHRLPWPMMVKTRQGQEGVLVDDVLECVRTNFDVYVSNSEYTSWPGDVKARARRAYRRRREQDVVIFQKEPVQWCRRSDYLGPNVYLYGLRPNSNFEGWTLLMGPRPPQ